VVEEGLMRHVGEFVETVFDTGALGATILYGRVIKSGKRVYVVEWESGIRNRLPHNDERVRSARNRALAESCIAG
jgi:hypothetical protein